MAGMIIPPGGFAGFAQMTPASRGALSGGVRPTRSSSNGKRSRRKASKSARRARTTTRHAKSGGKKLKFGSPAWRKKYNKKRK